MNSNTAVHQCLWPVAIGLSRTQFTNKGLYTLQDNKTLSQYVHLKFTLNLDGFEVFLGLQLKVISCE